MSAMPMYRATFARLRSVRMRPMISITAAIQSGDCEDILSPPFRFVETPFERGQPRPPRSCLAPKKLASAGFTCRAATTNAATTTAGTASAIKRRRRNGLHSELRADRNIRSGTHQKKHEYKRHEDVHHAPSPFAVVTTTSTKSEMDMAMLLCERLLLPTGAICTPVV